MASSSIAWVIEGCYLDGKTSNRLPARLDILPSPKCRVRMCWKNPLHGTQDSYRRSQEFDFLALDIASRLGNTPREIAFDDGGLFVTEDHDGIDRLLILCKEKRRPSDWLHRAESSIAIAIAAACVTGVFCWAMFVYGFPAAAKAIAFQMPDFVERKLGGSLAVLDKSLFDPSELSPDAQERITQLVKPFIEAYPALNVELEFRSGMGPNAFALPTGQIVFTDEFVNLANSDEELVAVFFHEMGHIEHRHMTRRALQGVMLSLAILFVAGDIESLDMLVGVPTLLADLSYSRGFEREADRYAVNLMTKHEVPVKSFADVMARFEEYYTTDDGKEDGDWPHYLSTHPATKERIKMINSHANKQP